MNIKDGSISLYPNPSSGKTKIFYDLDERSEIKIELYDPLGRKLRIFMDMKEEAGRHEHEIDVSDMPSGSYFIRIQMNAEAVLKPIVIIK